MQPSRWFVIALLFLIATNAWSETHNKTVTIKKTNITVVAALDMIKQQTGASIVYQEDAIDRPADFRVHVSAAEFFGAGFLAERGFHQ